MSNVLIQVFAPLAVVFVLALVAMMIWGRMDQRRWDRRIRKIIAEAPTEEIPDQVVANLPIDVETSPEGKLIVHRLRHGDPDELLAEWDTVEREAVRGRIAWYEDNVGQVPRQELGDFSIALRYIRFALLELSERRQQGS